MEPLFAPDHCVPAVLALGVEQGERAELTEICHAAGYTLDVAADRHEATELFFQRGGHELVLCRMPLADELVDALEALEQIDPELVTLKLPDLSGLAAEALSEAGAV